MSTEATGSAGSAGNKGTFVEKGTVLGTVRVEAIRWTGENWPEVERWLAVASEATRSSASVTEHGAILLTDDKWRFVRCERGWWLVWEGLLGGIHALPDAEFEARYEREVASSKPTYAEIEALADGPRGRATILDQVDRMTGETDEAAELRRWRTWAGVMLKEPDASTDDAMLRRKIAAVMDAPAVIAVDEADGLERFRVTDSTRETIVPGGQFEVTLRAETFDKFKGLVREYATKLGHAVHDVQLLTERGFMAGAEHRARAGLNLEAVADYVVEACARVGHEVYRAGFEGTVIPTWDDMAVTSAYSTIARATVRAVLDGVPPSTWFEKWKAEMLADGWTLGADLDPMAKRHPNLVERYELLPEGQRALDQVFIAAVLATARAVGEYEEAFAAVPVIKLNGDVSPATWEEFKRKYQAQVASDPTAWKTPIVDASPVTFVRSASPYTRWGTIAFIDRLISVATDESTFNGSFREVEMQVLLLSEVRAFVFAGQAGADGLTPAYDVFVDRLFSGRGGDDPLSTLLEAAGRLDEFFPLMAEFIESQRAAVERLAKVVGS